MEIRIDDLEVDPEIQLAARGVDQSTVTNYVDALSNDAKLPPVVAFRENGDLWLADGFHRVQAHTFLGMTTIEADVKTGTRQDAMIYAALANVVHGKPMSQREKREAGERLLRLTNWSDYEIGKRIAVDRSTVTKWRSDLSSEISLDKSTERTVTRGDTTYTMDTANIGRREYEPAEPTTPNSFFAVGEDDILRQAQSIKRDRQEIARQRIPEPATTPDIPQDKYRCIVIDPPWPVQKIEREERPNQGISLDYPTMTLEEIESLPVRGLAYQDGCHLYLWVTQKLLPVGLSLIESWGFRYQCLMTWVKPTGMTPYSWMYNTEHVIFARCGNLQLTRMGIKLSFDAPVQGHSKKPDIFYSNVAAASPEKRLEMFARQQRDGFDVWGNEV